MKKLLFALATLAIVACENKPKIQETTSDLNLPEYKLLSTEEPKVSSNGNISPTQNLVYNIEIDHPLPKDSLELIQDYFIEKGESDFNGINKVIVRAYLAGTSVNGTPYASMNLIAGEKEILIDENAVAIQELNETPQDEAEDVNADPIVGTYYCNRTHDTYVFKSNNTGYFTIQGSGPSEFTWKRSGKNVTIVYEVFGPQKLQFDQKAQTLTEKSESFGKLVFEKQ